MRKDGVDSKRRYSYGAGEAVDEAEEDLAGNSGDGEDERENWSVGYDEGNETGREEGRVRVSPVVALKQGVDARVVCDSERRV